ncbi:MAG TPA: RNA polymerase sigma factor [Saprospiraceae bacterium]|nr:RNA polymerase sigma factor [Saprospiraceae bacterium]
MKHADDEIILGLIKNSGSLEKGFRALMEKYQEKLYWNIRRMVLNHDDADDVLQNTFIKVYRNIEQFEQKSSLFTWLYRIATNETLSFIERNKKWKHDNLEDQSEHPAILALKSDPYFDGDEISLRLEAAVLTLPDKQRQVFQMRYYEVMTYKEIAEILDTSEGALKASFHHAVKKIEEYVKSKEDSF